MKSKRREDLKGDEITIEEEGESLCQLAIDAGYPDCAPLRANGHNTGKDFLNRALRSGDVVFVPDKEPKPAKKGDKDEHRFVRAKASVTLRFVHGTSAPKPEDDPSLTALCISNMRPDKGGDNRAGTFPDETVTGYNAIGDGDPDSFKVEVVDVRTKKDELKVTLEALRPTFDGGGAITGHGPFGAGPITAGERAKRSVEIKPKRVVGQKIFLSPYLKLVVDQPDKDARPKQALLTAPAPTIDDRIEILDQQVQAVYELDSCPGAGDAKCRITGTLDIGKDKKRVRVALHVLRTGRDAPGVMDLAPAETQARKYMRELYAQANLSMKYEVAARLVQPPHNMIAIADADGRSAEGGKKIRVKVTVGAKAFEAEVTTVAAETPLQTADKLKAAIDIAAAAQVPIVAVKVWTDENSPLAGKVQGSADVIVGDPMLQVVKVEVLVGTDANHTATAVKLESADPFIEFGGADMHVGTMQERILIKNYDTGLDRIDLFVVDNLQGSYGEAWHAGAPAPNSKMVSSCICRSVALTDDHMYPVMPHECGHILMTLGNHLLESTEVSSGGREDPAGLRVITGMKRISDPVSGANKLAHDGGGSINPTHEYRTPNPGGIIAVW